MRFFLSGLWLFLCIVCVAQVGLSNDTKGAKRAFKQGAALFEKQQYIEAAEKFREAYEIRPKWKLLYNIGQCETAARHYGVALELFESYMAAGGDNIGVERSNELIREMERLRNLVGYFDFKMMPAGGDVIIDNFNRGKSPLPGPLAVSAGVAHQVRVEIDGEAIFDRPLRVHSGQTIDVLMDEKSSTDTQTDTQVGPVLSDEKLTTEQGPGADATIAADTTSTSSNHRPLKIAGWTTLGLGAGTLITAAITGAMALSKKNEIESDCKGGCPSELEDEEATVNNLGLTTDVLIGVGAGVAATGVVLLLIGRAKDKRAQRDLSVVPSIGHGMAGLVTTGVF